MSRENDKRLDTQTWSALDGAPTVQVTVPGLTILAHPEARRVGDRVALLSLSSGRHMLLSRLEPNFSPPEGGSSQALAVPYLSRNPWQIHPLADGGIRWVRGDSPTSLTANGKPVETAVSFSAEDIESGVVLLFAWQVVLLLHRFRPLFPDRLERYGLVGESDCLLDLCRQIAQVADLEVPVLLRGESGTGKELVAAALHAASRRRDRPFHALNLAALPASLATAELFGASRGAFTGADQARRGYFRRAHGGTLFLDEIGETPQEVQPLLLRALENGEVQPLGSEETVRTDVRILAATDTDLEQAVATGRFRAPLLHRLSGYAIHLPALRERRDDIGRLLVYFLRLELAALGAEHRLDRPGLDGPPWPPAQWIARLAMAAWPGNVRQLRNVARHLAIGSRSAEAASISPTLERLLAAAETAPRQAPASGGRQPATAVPEGPEARGPYRSPQEITEEELLATLAANRWRPRETAQQLGISRPSLYSLLDTFPSTRKAMDLSREEILAAKESCNGRLSEMSALLKVSASGIRRRMREIGLLPS